MAGRAKKDANEALAKLHQYLRRDPHAVKLLESITRYQGSLRQERSQLKEEVKSVRHSQQVELQCREQLLGKAQELRLALDKEQAAVCQLKCDIACLRDRIAELEAELEPPGVEDGNVSVPEDLRSDFSAVKRLVKEVQKRIRVVPRARHLTASKPVKWSVSMIDIRPIVTDYKDDQYTTIGMLAVLSAMLGFPLGFEWKPDADKEGLGAVFDCDEERYQTLMASHLHWMRNWFGKATLRDRQYLRKGQPIEPHPKDLDKGGYRRCTG